MALFLGIVSNYVGYDSDAQAFITAAGLTDATQKTAINDLVVSLKANSIWTKMLAIYPFVGGTAATHKWNLKDPQDSNAAFRLTFNGTGYTHSSTGVATTGTTYANTWLNGNTYLGTASYCHLSIYSRTVAKSAGVTYPIGEFASGVGNCSIIIRNSTNTSALTCDAPGAAYIGALFTNLDGSGYYLGNQNGTHCRIYRNGTAMASDTGANRSQSIPNYNVYIFAGNQAGSAIYYDAREYAFASIGYGLTDTDCTNLSTAVLSYQMKLGRCTPFVIQEYKTSGTFTWTASFTGTAYFECYGGGGAGAGRTAVGAGGGGGGGAFASVSASVISGQNYTIVVGATRSGTTGNASNGNLSSVTNPSSTVIALAVGGSSAVSTIGGDGGLAASCTGTTTRNGGTGYNGEAIQYANGGPGGGCAGIEAAGGNATEFVVGTNGGGFYAGNGGVGGYGDGFESVNGTTGEIYGGGGGGGYCDVLGSPALGGNGRSGCVIVYRTA